MDTLNGVIHNPVVCSQSHIRIKMKIAFERDRFSKFDEGIFYLLDELGPNKNYLSDAIDIKESIILTTCDAFPETPGDNRFFYGLVEIGISKDALPTDVGIPLILAMSCYLATFKNIHSCTVLDVNLPDDILDNGAYPGPSIGAEFIKSKHRARIGVIIKPRFASNAEYIRKYVDFAGRSGVDYISDDELTVGGRHLSSIEKMNTVMETLEKVEKATGYRPKYITNITGNVSSVHKSLEVAKKIGVDGVMVNTFSMGYEALSHIRNECGTKLAMIANGLGLGVLTRGPDFRLATELVAKLSRLSGADGFYTGPMVGKIDYSNHSASLLSSVLTQPLGVSSRIIPPSAAFMSGGIRLHEIIQNTMSYKAPLYLSMGYGFTEFFAKGQDGKKIVECIQEISRACETGGIDEGRKVVLRYSKKRAYIEYIKALNAENAVS